MSRELLRNQQTTIRFAIIGLIVLAMLIPLSLVEGVTEERQSFFDSTLLDIANAWGNAQNVAGPFLIVPEIHRYQAKNEANEMVWYEVRSERVFLPDELKLDVLIEHQFRKRAIYEVPVYSARVGFAGTFAPLDAGFLNQEDTRLLLEQARIVVGISHTQAISRASVLTFGASEVEFRSRTSQQWIGSGVHAPLLDFRGTEAMAFAFELQLKGTRQFGFSPVANLTQVQMSSSWPHPSFKGTYLPERYEIREEGFSAEWMVHELAGNLPSSWRVDQQEVALADSFAWVKLFQPVTEYTTVDRAIKYGLLFIALTFLGFVCFELRTSLRFHPVQYGVVGAGLVLFYLALLSLSEHIAFGPSYLIATALLTALIGWYVWAMTGLMRVSGSAALVIASLYGTLYVLLQLEAFALLAGTGVLFIGLVALMASTRSLTSEVA